MNDKMREEFKLWAVSQGLKSKGTSVGYGDAYALGAWHGWQASRQAIEIELPTGFQHDHAEYMSDWVLDCKEVESAIRAAGILIKGE